jgi:hypothetical protein
MSNKQAMWSVMAMLTIWCTWNSASINGAIKDNEKVNEIVNNLIEEYTREEVSSDEYEEAYFSSVFAQYRALYGSGYTFEWNGNMYTTDYEEEAIISTNGWVLNSDDYDDYCKSNYHDECGICDGNGSVRWFADRDGDGLGDSTTFTKSCDEPVASK